VTLRWTGPLVAVGAPDRPAELAAPDPRAPVGRDRAPDRRQDLRAPDGARGRRVRREVGARLRRRRLLATPAAAAERDGRDGRGGRGGCANRRWPRRPAPPAPCRTAAAAPPSSVRGSC